MTTTTIITPAPIKIKLLSAKVPVVGFVVVIIKLEDEEEERMMLWEVKEWSGEGKEVEDDEVEGDIVD